MIRIGVSKSNSMFHEPVIVKSIVEDPGPQHIISLLTLSRDKTEPTKGIKSK